MNLVSIFTALLLVALNSAFVQALVTVTFDVASDASISFGSCIPFQYEGADDPVTLTLDYNSPKYGITYPEGDYNGCFPILFGTSAADGYSIKASGDSSSASASFVISYATMVVYPLINSTYKDTFQMNQDINLRFYYTSGTVSTSNPKYLVSQIAQAPSGSDPAVNMNFDQNASLLIGSVAYLLSNTNPAGNYYVNFVGTADEVSMRQVKQPTLQTTHIPPAL